MNDNLKRQTKAERREQAREQARLAREAEKKREKRNRLFLQGGIVLGVIAVLAVVGLVLVQTMKPAGPGPLNMASGGVIFEKDLAIVTGPALQPDQERVAPAVDRDELPLDITVYVDYNCVHCAGFEQATGEILETWVGSGDATLQIYPVTIQDAVSGGYSTRAANLLGCVVDQDPAPGLAFALHSSLLSEAVYTNIVRETGGLSNDQLLEQAELVGIDVNDELKMCVKETRYAQFFAQNTKVATETGVLGLAEGAQLAGSNGLQPADEPQRLQGTPLIVINGQQWNTTDGSGNYADFESYLLKTKAQLDGNSSSSTSSSDSSSTNSN